MLLGLYIFVDDDFLDPVYAEPELDELDVDLRQALCVLVDDAIEGDRSASGVVNHGKTLIGYRWSSRTGISHVALVSDGIAKSELVEYLNELAKTYNDEVDAPRTPERDGVADIVAEVMPPWDD